MTEPSIHLGKVKVPLLDYAVSCSAILGIRDSGKTVTAKGIAEQMLEANIPFVVFDAVGKWRWMKVPGPGARGRGYKVVVAGGRVPDLALNAHSVSEIVRSAVKEKIPLIIDLYDPNLSKADWRRIVQESIRIIHYEANGVAHVFLEEAAEFIPQKVTDGATYAEVEKLARMGGNASVGITLINQRSQEVNKAVLDLAVNLILGCQVGNRAIEAVDKWIDKLAPDKAKEVAKSLPRLQSGQAWVWTRSNPDDPSLEQLPMCRSLHPDRRTPDVALRSAKAVDPDEFVQRLATAIPKLIEEAKANDPIELKKKVRELQAQVTNLAPAKATSPGAKPKIVEKRIMVTQSIARLEKLAARLDEVVKEYAPAVSEIRKAIAEGKALNAEAGTFNAIVRRETLPAPSPRLPVKSSAPAGGNGGGLTGPEQKILNELAEFEAVGVSPVEKIQVALFCGYSNAKSGGFSGPLGALSTKGMVEYPSPGMVKLTPSGAVCAAAPGEPMTLQELQHRIVNKVSGPCANILRKVIPLYPDSLDKVSLAADLGYSNAKSGGFSGPLGTLSKLGLVRYPSQGFVAASELLFPARLR